MASGMKKLGGVKLPHSKSTQGSQTQVMPAPAVVVIPLKQHIGTACEPLVAVGDEVKVGQKIADSGADRCVPIHASVSGKVKAIESFLLPDGEDCRAVVIEADGEQQHAEGIGPVQVSTREEFIKAVRESGAVGLGGAGFPTHVKLSPPGGAGVDTLILNGAECEPYVTSDFRQMVEDPDSILEGAALVKKYLGIKKIIIGIEADKPEAIKALADKTAADPDIEVKTLSAFYPQGAEKVLIHATTGKVLPEGKLPFEIGCLVMNVCTCAHIANYMRTGMPLVAKRVTVDGDAVATPKNILAPIGTSYADLIEYAGGLKAPAKKILMGGPMMGIAVKSETHPVMKQNNAVLALGEEAAREKPELGCIRCSRCIDACPVALMPVNIERSYEVHSKEKLEALKVNLCIECGCCAYVCPAGRRLVAVNRMAKTLIAQ